jgi:hypothetical protein
VNYINAEGKAALGAIRDAFEASMVNMLSEEDKDNLQQLLLYLH